MKIIIISLDTLRADHLSCYGYPLPVSPHIDAIAQEGARFETAIAGDIPTQPAHTSLFTGRLGVNHRIVAHGWPMARLEEESPWLPSLLNDRGLTTAAVDNLLDMKDWFARGYQYYIKPKGLQLVTADAVNTLAFSWLEAHAKEDFFLFLHYWDAHTPYVPPDPFRQQWVRSATSGNEQEVLQRLAQSPTYPFFKHWHYDVLGRIPSLEYVSSLYDAEIAFLDHHIGQLIKTLQRLHIYDEVAMILFADHGENMAEHDAYWDHAGLYDSNVRIPLILRYPKAIAPQVVRAMVQPVDVFPTVCDLLDTPVPATVDGRSLWPVLQGARDEQYDTVFLSECTWQAKRGVRTSRWKFIKSYDPGVYGRSESELYDLRLDPGETTNVIQQHPEVAKNLEHALLSWVEDRLENRPDPLKEVIRTELPGVSWMDRLLREKHHITWEQFKQTQQYI